MPCDTYLMNHSDFTTLQARVSDNVLRRNSKSRIPNPPKISNATNYYNSRSNSKIPKRRSQNVHFDAKKRDKSFSESLTDTSSIQKE